MIAGIGIARGEGALELGSFPGRWNPRRAIPTEIEPLATASALALESAGWWRPGGGEACLGGMIVACDHACFGPAEKFARELRGATGAIGPSGFLFSLPSTAASALGILFGFAEYQATLAGGAAVGAQALRQALDLLELGRLHRVLLAALSVSGDERIAVAWCLDPVLGHLLEVDCGVVEGEAGATIRDPTSKFPAADLLLEASGYVGALAGPYRVARGGAWITLEPKGN